MAIYRFGWKVPAEFGMWNFVPVSGSHQSHRLMSSRGWHTHTFYFGMSLMTFFPWHGATTPLCSILGIKNFKITLQHSFSIIVFQSNFGLPFPLLPSNSKLHAFFTHSSSFFLNTLPNHHRLPCPTYSTIASFNPSIFISSLMCNQSTNLTPHIFLFICLSALLRISSSSDLTTQASELYAMTGLAHNL